jgi:hypothetical protein
MVGIISKLCLDPNIGCLKNNEEIETFTIEYAIGRWAVGVKHICSSIEN